MDPAMMEFLENFENALEGKQRSGQLRMLNFACAEKVFWKNKKSEKKRH
jgi:hypothetical protein